MRQLIHSLPGSARVFIAAVAIFFAFASCTREQEAEMATLLQLHARIEGGAETRVEFDEASGKFAWTDGDEIDIHTSAGAYRSISLDATGGFSLPLESGEERNGYAVYPAGIVTGDAELTLKLPAGYDIDGSMDAFYPSAMIARNDPESDDLFFHHAGSVIELTLNAVPANTKSFAVTLDKRIAGAFAVVGPDSDTPQILTDDTDAGKTVTFTLPSALTAETNAFVLHLPVPVGTYETLKIEMKNSAGSLLKTYTHDKSRFCARARGRKAIFPLEVFSFGTVSGSAYKNIAGTPVIWFNGHAEQETTVQIVSTKSFDGGLSQISVPLEIMGYATANAEGNCNEDWTTERPASLLTFNVTNKDARQKNLVVRVSEQTEKTVHDEIVEHAQILKSRTPADHVDLAFQDIGDGLTPRESGKPRTANCYIVDRPGTYRFPLVYGNAIDWEQATSTGWNTGAYYYWSGANTNEIFYQFPRFDDNLITSPYILQDVGLTAEDVEAVVVWEDVPSADYSMLTIDPVISDLPVSGYCLRNGTPLATVPYISFEVPVGSIDLDENKDKWERVTGIRQGNIVVALRTKESEAPVTVAGNEVAPGTILWSWHIWITDLDLTTKTTIPQQFQYAPASDEMMPYNLGWCDTRFLTQWHDRSWYVKLRQTEGTTEPLVVKVIQKGDKTGGNSSSPYYQWGRKDPFLPSTGTSNLNKPAYSPIGRTLTSSDSAVAWSDAPSAGPASSIQHPEILYYTQVTTLSHTWGTQNSWMAESRPCNLWNIRLNVDENSHHNVSRTKWKSVYEPTPVGFTSPHMMSFSFAVLLYGNWNRWESQKTEDLTHFLGVDRNGDGVLTSDDYDWGWWLYTGTGDGTTIFLPACGERNWADGALSHVNSFGHYQTTAASDRNSAHKCKFTLSYYYSWNGAKTQCTPIRPIRE